ncbi:MAG: cold-shock protein [Alphaproteobacteria bacterium]|jgi:CspA family cold shock protein|uniref:Cold-shock protein n=1 Tax=PS1 clade bacterium TaxID=2175152 RepID=A0A368DKC6_9PROT|nr:cold-shock protein [Rhodobiaceae bacterium]MBH21434.1 cold-shock protein [Rhodobiaceae bacterium]OUT75078.1 MAG: cold-shock protein [Rhizobiales bacterium TMED25]RCL71645.1 MAG: cold-shock protein [PS1 clade bacterium]|tara:strand:+ start:422 stop:628 length:207 start_codon:yes stop_codon:yes gene_type:complete
MANGKVKWFNLKKGYGFIEPEDGTKDIFVHVSALQNSGISNLLEEQQVTYDVAKEKGKTSAVNISISE